MGLDGAVADLEQARDLLAGGAGHDVLRDLAFAYRQPTPTGRRCEMSRTSHGMGKGIGAVRAHTACHMAQKTPSDRHMMRSSLP